MKKCKIENCENVRKSRGWCAKHYQRWRRHGDPTVFGDREVYMSPEEAFEARTIPEPNTGCLLWTGAPESSGYGRVNVDGRSEFAHRYAYRRVFGEIPKGLLIDHICHTPACVNVDHLRTVTHQENMMNRSGPTVSNVTGVRGVDKRGEKYRAVVTRNQKHIHLGYFDTLEEASKVAEQARDELFKEFAGRG